MLQKGDKVLIQGLQAKPELNGLCGQVLETLPSGRIKVKVTSFANSSIVAESNDQQFLSLKLDNLTLLPPDDAASETLTAATKSFDRDAQSLPKPSISTTITSFLMPIVSPAQNVWSEMGFFFYPFGNTCAKRLTAYVAPDQDVASILLLGCGDFRHILFTCWSHEKAGGIAARQRHEVLACDLKSSIIARDLILWKLIYDNVQLNKVWVIFYAKFLDEVCLDLLRVTALSLLDLAESWTQWNLSDFGSLCPFVDEASYVQACMMWKFYADNGRLSTNQVKRQAFEMDGIRKRNKILSSVLQCDPVYPIAMKNIDEHNEYTKQYVSGNVDIFKSVYVFPKSSQKATLFSNPMMLEGNKDRVDLHYNLDPPSGFHPSLAYGPLQDTDKVIPGLSTTNKSAQFKADMLTKNAFAEFSAWCQATKARMDRRLVVVHIHVGNAFDLVHSLIARRLAVSTHTEGPCYLSSNGKLSIPETVPVQFDAIDTSNLSHFCGLLNILLTCKMLLKTNLQSTIFTEISSSATKVIKFSKMLEGLLGIDVKTFSILTGLMPVDYPSTTMGQLRTALTNKEIFKTQQGEHLHLRWKIFEHTEDATNTLRLSIAPQDFVAIFEGVYRKLFDPVLNPLPSLSNVEDSKSTYKTMKSIMGNDISNPTSQTFALFVRIALDRMSAVPPAGLTRLLFDRICETGYMMQGNVLQDLVGWFAQYQVFSKEDMRIVVEQNFAPLGVRWNSPQVAALTKSCTRNDEAFLVLVTLLVPKQVFVDAAKAVPAPVLHMGVIGRFDNVFHSFSMTYLRQRPPANTAWSLDSLLSDPDNNCATVDDCAWIACSTVMPICSFVFGEANRVFVELRYSVHSVKKQPDLMYKLGPQLRIHAAPFSDKSQISCKLVPYGSNPLDNFLSQSFCPLPAVEVTAGGSKLGTCPAAVLTKDSSHTYFTSKLQFDDIEAAKAYSPKIKQLPKPNEIGVQLTPSLQCKLVFPVPIDATRSGVSFNRAAGTLSCITLPLSSKTVPNRFAHLHIDPAHLRSTSSSSEHYSLYGVPHLLLDTLPEVKLDANSELLSTILLKVVSGMTEAEREAQRADSKDKTSIGSWKETVHALFHFLAVEGNSMRSFSLHTPENGIEIFLHINAVRMEYAADRTVVLDIAVCVPEKETVQDLLYGWYLPKDGSQRKDIVVTPEEMKLWKRILPALIERVRNDWHHNATTCEYLQTASIPLCDDGLGEKVLCSCCLGQQLAGTMFMEDLKSSCANNAASNFARAAIPIIFSMD